MKLEQLGFNEWFKSRFDGQFDSAFSVARIAEVNKDRFIIKNETGEASAEVTGKFLFSAQSGLEMPAVGDWVVVQFFDEGALAIIHEILPRKTLLKRKTPGKTIDYQLIAANIDYAFIVQALEHDFNLNRLERYLVMVNDGGIEPVILLSKSDLVDENERKSKIESIQRLKVGINILAFSNITEDGLDAIANELIPGKTYCLLGSSGVGKTTLLNRLTGSTDFKTGAIREKDKRGRHITTRRQLTCLENGSMIIDTPGLRELSNFGAEAGMAETFGDLYGLAGNCRFSDCTHTHEAGCAITEAVRNGSIEEARYKNFIKLQKESRFYEMSYIERRKRDKNFGKMAKQILKNHPKK